MRKLSPFYSRPDRHQNINNESVGRGRFILAIYVAAVKKNVQKWIFQILKIVDPNFACGMTEQNKMHDVTSNERSFAQVFPLQRMFQNDHPGFWGPQILGTFLTGSDRARLDLERSTRFHFLKSSNIDA